MIPWSLEICGPPTSFGLSLFLTPRQLNKIGSGRKDGLKREVVNVGQMGC